MLLSDCVCTRHPIFVLDHGFGFVYLWDVTSFTLRCWKTFRRDDSDRLGSLNRNFVIGWDTEIFEVFFTIEQGHLVWRCFEKLLCLQRKWNGFLHLVCASLVSGFCFFAIRFLFSGATSRQYWAASFCLFVQTRKPAKNSVLLISSSASSRAVWPDTLSSDRSWLGSIPNTPKKHGCLFILLKSLTAQLGMDVEDAVIGLLEENAS